MTGRLDGKRIAILATDGFEESELTQPLEALRREGATVEVVAPHGGRIQGMKHHDKTETVAVDRTLDEVGPDAYDGLVLPGGVANPDQLRTEPRAVDFARAFLDEEKPIAAICHGPWTLIEADGVDGRTLTSWPSLRTDIRNAGGDWVDRPVVADHGLVTSRGPQDLPQFCDRIVEEFATAGHAGQ